MVTEMKAFEERKVEDAGRTAVNDLKYVTSQLGYSLMHNVNIHSLFDNRSEKICDVLVVAHNNALKVANFPSVYLDKSNAKMHVALVCYDDTTACNVYLIPVKKVKIDKKNQMGVIKVASKEKMDKYSFGNTIKGLSA